MNNTVKGNQTPRKKATPVVELFRTVVEDGARRESRVIAASVQGARPHAVIRAHPLSNDIVVQAGGTQGHSGGNVQRLTFEAWEVLQRFELPRNASVALVGEPIFRSLELMERRKQGMDSANVDVQVGDIDLMIFVHGASDEWIEQTLLSLGARAKRTTVQVGRYRFTGAHVGNVHLHFCQQFLRDAQEFAGMIDVPEFRLVSLVDPATMRSTWGFKGLGNSWLTGEITSTTAGRVRRADRRGYFVPNALMQMAEGLEDDAVIHLRPEGYLTQPQFEALEARRAQLRAEEDGDVSQWRINVEALQASETAEEDAGHLSGVITDDPEDDDEDLCIA